MRTRPAAHSLSGIGEAWVVTGEDACGVPGREERPSPPSPVHLSWPGYPPDSFGMINLKAGPVPISSTTSDDRR